LINPLIYAEVSMNFDSIEQLDEKLPRDIFRRADLPWEASFLAARAFQQYRKRGGIRTSTLSDFYIGAHAAVSGASLLTRDSRHYKSYFPRLALITPDQI
jgi:predicted nucleic acid-binding protein